MKKISIFIVSFFLTLSVFGQNENDPINFKSFDQPLLHGLILKYINHVRDSLHLEQLQEDSILSLAAKAHSNYVKKTELLQHVQEVPEFATLEKRVEYFKGTHEVLGENVEVVQIDKPTQIYKETSTIKITTYAQAAYFFGKTAVNTTNQFENVSSGKYSRTGISFAINEEKKSIYMVQVFGSKPFTFPPSIYSKDYKKTFFPSKKENIYNAYQLQPSNDRNCGKCVTSYKNIPAEIEAKVYVLNNQIYYHFSDLEEFTKIFKDGDEALAIEIVQENQFLCKDINVLHRSFAYDGLLFSPVKVTEILKKNEKKTENQVLYKFGTVPPEITGKFDCNLLLIKNQQICARFIRMPSVNPGLQIIETVLFTDTVAKSEITKSKNLRFSIPFEKDKFDYSEKDIKPIYDSLELNKYNIKQAIVLAYASVEGSTERNYDLQKKRAQSLISVLQSFQLDTIKKVIRTFENWDQFKKDIKYTSFNYLNTLSKEEIKVKLQDEKILKELEPVLKNHRKAVLFLKIVEKIDLANNKEDLVQYYANALSVKDIATATTLQTALINAVMAGEIDLAAIDTIAIPKIKDNAQLLNNKQILKYYLKLDENHIDSLEEYSKLDPSNVFIKYNILDLKLKGWKDSTLSVSAPEPLIKQIKSLYNTKVDKKLVNRLYVNYHILVAGHYKNIGKYKYSNDAVNLVKKYYRTVETTPQDLYALATFFGNYKRTEWALEILFPIIQNTPSAEYDEDILFYFLSISLGNLDLFDRNEMLIYLQRARELDPVRFCKLYGDPDLSFQLLKDEGLKTLYCESCIIDSTYYREY